MVGRIQVRLVTMGAADAGAQIVRDQQFRTPAEEFEGAHVRADPIRQGLRPGRLGEGITRGPEHGDEDLRLAHLPGLAVDDRHRLPGVVDEQLLASAMLLAHHQVEFPGPGPILVAEPAVLEPLRVQRLVFLPQQRQRHVLASQLPVHLAPHRQRARRAARRRRRIQPPFQTGVVERLGHGPTEPGHLGPPQVIAYGRRRRPQAAGNRPDAQRRGEVQPQHLSNLAHRQPPVRQRSPPVKKTRRVSRAGGLSRAAQPRPRVIALDRIQ